MESSDDSFAWTSGSDSATSDSSSKMVKNATDNSAEESEYGKKYKKKLQKQLFHNETQNGTSDSETPKKKAKKRKIKTEDEDKNNITHEDSDDEQYLATRVKQEKNRSLSVSSSGGRHSDGGSRKKRKLDNSIKPEKTKKKMPSEDESDHHSDYTNIEDKFTAEETVVQPRLISNTTSKQNRNSSISISQDIEENSDNNRSSKKKNRKKSKVSVSAESDSMQPEPVTNGIDGADTPQKGSSKRSSKLSERLTFEEDDCQMEYDNSSELSSHLKKYLKRNPNLQPLECVPEKEAVITSDDEVWLLKFPSDVDISSLQQSTLTVDTKCKTKIAGSTYDGVVEDGESSATLLSYSHNRPLIRNTPLNATVKFNKRIPKIHIVEHNVMLNNQTNFIPLPDTKCRHPLFGSHYKKAIKLPSAVKSRLNDIHSEEDHSSFEVKKKKKSKKHKEEVVKEEEEAPRVAKKRKHRRSEAEASAEPEADQPAPKKKKHKHTTDPVAWESEKAIEENLFNF